VHALARRGRSRGTAGLRHRQRGRCRL